jgi:sulfur-carrier protein
VLGGSHGAFRPAPPAPPSGSPPLITPRLRGDAAFGRLAPSIRKVWYACHVARVCFTQNLKQHVKCPEEDALGETLRQVLDGYFARHPEVRSYVLDEHGGLRPHVVIFIGADRASDRVRLADRVPPGAEVWIMQALSGG